MDQAMKCGVGINPGYGYVKVVMIEENREPQTVTLPALVVKAQRQVLGALARIQSVQVGGMAWWVGEDALLSPDARSAMTQDRLKDEIFIPALVKAALMRLSGNGQPIDLQHAACVSGLPATWSLDKALASALVQRLRAAGPLGTIKVIPEPLGLIYSVLLDDAGEVVGDEDLRSGRVAVIDLGHNTVDVATLNHMVPEPQGLATYHLGTVRPLSSMQQKISAAFEVETSLYEVDQAVRHGSIRVAGSEAILPAGCEEVLRENGQSIAMRLVEAWGKGNQFSSILIGGGGAELPALVDAIVATFKHARVVPNAQLAVALGYARLARYVGKRAYV